MTQTLSRTGLVIPSADFSDGVDPVRDLRRIGQWIEDTAGISLQGTLADMPVPGKPRRFYKPTDSGYGNVLYYDTGAVWVQVGSVSPPSDPAANIPGLRTLGGGDQQAAKGNHSHSADAITSGTLSAARLPSSVRSVRRAARTGNVFSSGDPRANGGGVVSLQNGTVHYAPILWPQDGTCGRIGTYGTSTYPPNPSSLQLALFADNGSFRPGTRLAFGSLSTSAGGYQPEELAVNQTLPAGIYWVAVLANGPTGATGYNQSTLRARPELWETTSTDQSDQGLVYREFTGGGGGSIPANATATASTALSVGHTWMDRA